MVRRAARGVGAVVLLLAAAGASRAALPPPADPVDLGGTPVEVSTDPRVPTVLTAGLWSDVLTGSGDLEGNAHQFRYERTMGESTVLVGVTGVAAEEFSDGIAVVVTAPDGSTCSDASTGSGAYGTAFGLLAVADAASYGDRNDACLTGDALAITVRRSVSDPVQDLPITIRVVEEAPVRDAEAALPAVPDPVPFSAPTPGEPTPVTGVASFADAPELTTGTWSDTVLEGTERLYRVRLGWGQALAVRLDVAAQSADDAAVLDAEFSSDPTVDLTLFDPLRSDFGGDVDDADPTGAYGDEADVLLEGTAPVAYLNRYDDTGATVPGDYWVSVAVTPAPVDREPLAVPVELSLAVVGEPGEPPTFPQTVAAPDTGAGPEGYDPATPYLVADGVFAAEVSGTPRGPGAADGADPEVRRVAGLVVGGLSLVALAAGAVLLRRRGRLSRAAAR